MPRKSRYSASRPATKPLSETTVIRLKRQHFAHRRECALEAERLHERARFLAEQQRTDKMQARSRSRINDILRQHGQPELEE